MPAEPASPAVGMAMAELEVPKSMAQKDMGCGGRPEQVEKQGPRL